MKDQSVLVPFDTLLRFGTPRVYGRELGAPGIDKEGSGVLHRTDEGERDGDDLEQE